MDVMDMATEVSKELAKIIGINLKKYGMTLGKFAEDIVDSLIENDYKRYVDILKNSFSHDELIYIASAAMMNDIKRAIDDGKDDKKGYM